MAENTGLISFGQYMASKQQLRDAANSTPHEVVEYTIKRYCKLIVGSDKSEKQQIPLKPKNKIKVEWLYLDVNNPRPMKIMFEGIECLEEDTYKTYWKSEKLKQWLNKNAIEEIPKNKL